MSLKNLTCVDLLYISGLHLFPFRIKINLQKLHVYFYFCKIVLMFLWDCVLQYLFKSVRTYVCFTTQQ